MEKPITILSLSFTLFFLLLNETTIAQQKRMSISTSETKGDTTINKKQLNEILEGERELFLVVKDYYKFRTVHDNLNNNLGFQTGNKINLTESIIKNYYRSEKFVKVFFTDTVGNDSLVYTINIEKLKFSKKIEKKKEICDTCRSNCLEVDSRTFIMDMCNKELCMNRRRPMLISSGRCVAYNKLKIGYDQLLSFLIVNNNPLKYELEVDHEDISFNTDHTDFDKAIAGLNPIQSNTASAKSFLPKDTIGVIDSVKTLIENIKTDLDTLHRLLEQVQTYTELKSHESCLNEFEIKKDAKDFLKRYYNAFATGGAESRFQDYINEIAKISNNSLSKQQVKTLDSLGIVNKNLIPDQIRQLKTQIGKLLSVSTTYALLPIQINDEGADVVEITVSRKDISNKASDEYKYDFRVRGGIKIDFSAGPFLSLLRDDKFTTKDIKDTLKGKSGADSIVSKRIIQKQISDNFSYMFGSLMHIYLRSGSFVNGSINLGAAVNTQQRAVLLTGVSLILGTQQRFCMNVGIAFSTVKRLASPYNIGDVYGVSGDVPVVDKYMAGFAFGFTYNLSKPKVVKKASE